MGAPSLLLLLTMWRPNLGVFSLSPFFFSWVLSRGLIYELHAGSGRGLFSLFVPKECMGEREGKYKLVVGSVANRDSIDWPCLLDNAYMFKFFVKGTIFRWWEQDACF